MQIFMILTIYQAYISLIMRYLYKPLLKIYFNLKSYKFDLEFIIKKIENINQIFKPIH